MFFQKLLPLLLTTKSLHITMEADKDEKVTLSVVPKYKDDNIKLPPIVVSGTVQEIDAGFADIFGKIEENSGIFTNIEMFIKQAKELEKSSKVKATPKAPAKTETPKETAGNDTEVDDNEEDGDNKNETSTSTESEKKKRGRKPTTATEKPEQKKVEIAGDLFGEASVGSEIPPAEENKPAIQEQDKSGSVEPIKPVEPGPTVQSVPATPIQPTITAPTPAPATPTITSSISDDDIF